jgi:hypothetical protein
MIEQVRAKKVRMRPLRRSFARAGGGGNEIIVVSARFQKMPPHFIVKLF